MLPLLFTNNNLHSAGVTGEGQVVAVSDTGIDQVSEP